MTASNTAMTALNAAVTKKHRLLAAEVLPWAEKVRDVLLGGHNALLGGHNAGAAANVRCEIAGSLRRGQREVGDVEIVLEPRFDADLFGNPLPTSAALDGAIEHCLKSGLLAWDHDTPRNGPRYKRFVLAEWGLPLDLFLTGEGNWGNILALRTGDADFSRLLVTRRAKGGLLPNWMRCGDGRLYGRAAGYPDYEQDDRVNEYAENVLPCPTEEAFFGWLWLPVPAMAQRNAASVAGLRREAVRRQQQAMRPGAEQKKAGKEALHV